MSLRLFAVIGRRVGTFTRTISKERARLVTLSMVGLLWWRLFRKKVTEYGISDFRELF